PARHPDLRKAIFQHPFQNQLCVLAIRLLLAYSLRADLGCVSDPQLKLQFPEQSFKPARMPTRFHPNTYLLLLCRQLRVELFRFLTVSPSALLPFPRFGIYQWDFLKARIVGLLYNDQCSGPFPPGFWLVCPPKVYSGPGGRHFYGIITL